MAKDVSAYFEKTVIPLITDKHPDVAAEMTIKVMGSFGLGIADEFSDLDCIIYLDDPLWNAQGGHVQLLLETSLPAFAADGHHWEMNVHPISWLRDLREFLNVVPENKAELPWEELQIEDLHEVQNCLIVRDPKNIFGTLRETTAPKFFPDWLWNKLLITRLKDLDETLCEFQRTIRRQNKLEATIFLGSLLEHVLHVGFIISREYYPWRKHLRWAFEKLPTPSREALPYIDVAVSEPDMNKKLIALESVWSIYTKHVAENNMLPGINIPSEGPEQPWEELVWAERLKAWSDPDWRNWIIRCQKRAEDTGHKEHWPIWSLWHW